MKVLITGANGFVGKNLRSYLSLNKDVEVFNYDRESTEEELDKYEKGLYKYWEEVNKAIQRDMAKAEKIRILSWEAAGEKYYK